MIHIIVYSTTNTAAKMYKKKKPFQNNSGGCDGWAGPLSYPWRPWRATYLSLLMVERVHGVFSKGRNIY